MSFIGQLGAEAQTHVYEKYFTLIAKTVRVQFDVLESIWSDHRHYFGRLRIKISRFVKCYCVICRGVAQ